MSHAFANVDRKTRGAERRIFRRRRVRSLAYVELGQGNGGIVLNVSEGGLAVQAVMAVAGDELPDMRLQLAHSNKEIRAKGRVTWTGEFRKLAGIEFVDLSVEALRQVREWIALEEPEERQAETTSRETHEASDSTIEFPPHLAMPDIVPNIVPNIVTSASVSVDSVPGAPVPPDASVSGSIPGSARLAARETKSQREVTSPRRTYLSAQERAAILGELKAEKETVPPAAEKLSTTEVPSVGSASSHSTPSARSAVSEAIPVESDSVRTEKRDSESASAVTATTPATSALNESPQRLSSPPADRYGFKLSMPSATVKAPSRHKSTIALVGAFAIVSLGIGWMAGRAGLREIVKNSTSDQAAPQAAAAVAAESPNISEIEVIDARNQRWLIPFQGPLSGHAGATALNAPGSSEARIGTSRAGAESQETGASASSNSGDSAPASLIKKSEAPVSIVPDSNQTPSAAGNGLIPGELVHRVEPEYPPDALAQGIEGSVKLDAVIDPNGNVKTIQPISGPQSLFAAATAAVRQWQYSPTMLDGRPIQTERQITITFQLTPTASK